MVMRLTANKSDMNNQIHQASMRAGIPKPTPYRGLLDVFLSWVCAAIVATSPASLPFHRPIGDMMSGCEGSPTMPPLPVGADGVPTYPGGVPWITIGLYHGTL